MYISKSIYMKPFFYIYIFFLLIDIYWALHYFALLLSLPHPSLLKSLLYIFLIWLFLNFKLCYWILVVSLIFKTFTMYFLYYFVCFVLFCIFGRLIHFRDSTFKLLLKEKGCQVLKTNGEHQSQIMIEVFTKASFLLTCILKIVSILKRQNTSR